MPRTRLRKLKRGSTTPRTTPSLYPSVRRTARPVVIREACGIYMHSDSIPAYIQPSETPTLRNTQISSPTQATASRAADHLFHRIGRAPQQQSRETPDDQRGYNRGSTCNTMGQDGRAINTTNNNNTHIPTNQTPIDQRLACPTIRRLNSTQQGIYLSK